MNASLRSLLIAAALMSASSTATNVGLSTIEQPVNLGIESDPTRIPLGSVATESNYHYGRGWVITAPRPALQGAMEWKFGTELNQNLASVFGIRVDNHDVPNSPVTEIHTPPPWLADFRKCAPWKSTETPVIIAGKEMNRRIVLNCSFVWDPRTANLAQGAVPHAKVVRTSDGALYVEAVSAPRDE